MSTGVCASVVGDRDLAMLTHRRGHVLSLSALTLFAFCAVLPKTIMTFFGHIMVYSICHDIAPSTLFISALAKPQNQISQYR